MTAVAEGAFCGLAATAEGDGWFVGGELEGLAARVDQLKGSFDDKRAVWRMRILTSGMGESLGEWVSR